MNYSKVKSKKYLAEKNITLCDLLKDVINQDDGWYPTFIDDGDTYITISHDQINHEIEARGYHSYCRRQLYAILKKEKERGELLVKRLASNVKAYSVLCAVRSPKKPVKFKCISRCPAISEVKNTVGTLTVGVPTVPIYALNPDSQPVLGKKNEKNKKNIYIDYKSNNKSNKSYINFQDKNLGGGKEEREPMLVQRLADLVRKHLGDKAMGFLDKHKSVWLHACYKKLGSTIEAFINYLTQLGARNWLRNQNWFGFKWIFTFKNIDKILSGGLKDFVVEKAQGAFNEASKWAYGLKQPAEVLVVKPELERPCTLASHYFRSQEFPKDTTKQDIQGFVDFLKINNYPLAESISITHLGVALPKQSVASSNFIPKVDPIERKHAVTTFGALESLLDAIKEKSNAYS